MFCSKCGATISPEEKFCSKCGAPVESSAKDTAPTTENATTSNSNPNKEVKIPASVSGNPFVQKMMKIFMVQDSRVNAIGFFAYIAMFICLFLPYVTVKYAGYKASGNFCQENYGFFVFLAFVAIIGGVLLFILKYTKATWITSGIMALCMLMSLIAKSSYGDVEYLGIKVYMTFGFYLMLIALIVAVVATLPVADKILAKFKK